MQPTRPTKPQDVVGLAEPTGITDSAGAMETAETKAPTVPPSRSDTASLLRSLPAVDVLLQASDVVDAAGDLPRPFVVDIVRELLDEARAGLLAGESGGWTLTIGDVHRSLEKQLAAEAAHRVVAMKRRFLTRIVNATGVVLHTNLGRAPLSSAALQSVADVAAGYSNLEYTVDTGKRGSRHDYGEAMLTRLTGAEAAMVVNNNAAAVLLVLSALAHGGEVILSRGEMIEIGGAFRVPEVMEQSGCVLREVGTTNRTHLRDYERAIGEQTAAILKVHPSNYNISGFTASVSVETLATLARRHGIPLIQDLGSGVLVKTEHYGLTHEPTVQASVSAGADIITFSGDKLLGGPQAGIIIGRKDLVDRCKAHPLARAVRVDKMTLAALQATLAAYLNGDVGQIPIYAMLGTSVDELRQRARAVVARTLEAVGTYGGQRTDNGGGGGLMSAVIDGTSGGRFEVAAVDTVSTVGGGSLPGETQPSAGIAVRVIGGPMGRAASTHGASADRWTPDRLAAELRRDLPPIVGRIEGDVLILDLRTVHPDDDGLMAQRLAGVLRRRSAPAFSQIASPIAPGNPTPSGQEGETR